MNYAKIEFLSISGVFLSSFWGLRLQTPTGGPGSVAGPDLLLQFKLHDICLTDSQENH